MKISLLLRTCVLALIGGILLIWLAFPPPPPSWSKLKRSIPRVKIHQMAISSNMEETVKLHNSVPFLKEIWRKKHLCGYWELRLRYYDDLSLSGAHVCYVRSQFPFNNRARP